MSVPYIAAAGLQLGVMVHQHELLVDFGEPYDLPRTLGVLQRGQGDPAVQVDRGSFGSGPAGTPGAGAWICRRVYSGTGEELGQVTYRLHQVSASAVRVRTAATSESLAVTAAHQAHGLLGGEDDWTELELLLNGWVAGSPKLWRRFDGGTRECGCQPPEPCSISWWSPRWSRK